jgi:peptide/nickel transport system substrate-binding protein
MRRRTACAPAMLLACVLGGAAGCGTDGESREAPPSAPVDGGTVVIGVFSEFDGLNELVSTDAPASEVMENLLYVPLLRWDEHFEIAPSLAKSWTFSEDRRVLTMELRDDIVWHDGVPTTADDVEFSFARFRDPALAYADQGSLRWLEGVKATGPFEVVFRFTRPYANQLADLRKIIVPKHLLEDIPSAEMESAAFNRHPVGNGPFRFVRWKQAQQVVFEANPDFPDGRPHVDRVIFRIIPDQTAIETALLSGEIDVVERLRFEQVGPLRRNARFRVFPIPQRGYQYIGWNLKSPYFAEAKTRRAMTLAIDRQRIIDALAFGEGKVTVHPVMSLSPIYDRSVEPYPYDPAEASRLLAEEGWVDSDGDGVLDRDGIPFAFTLLSNFGNQMREDTLVMIQDDLQKIGIAVTPEMREWSVFLDDIKAKRFDACHLSWQTDFVFDPYDIFHTDAIDGKYNMTSYSNAAVDSLMDAAALAPTPERALPLWHQMLGILHREQPYTILYELVYSTGVSSRVRGVDMDVRSYLVGIRDWWIAPGDRKYAS